MSTPRVDALTIEPPLTSMPVDPAAWPTVSIRMPFAAPLVETVANVTPPAPTVTPLRLSAVPVVVVMLLPEPVTLIVPPPVASKPMPLVVSMSSPPPVKLIVAPVLVSRSRRCLSPVLTHLAGVRERDGAAGIVVDRNAACRSMMLIAPDSVTLPVPWIADVDRTAGTAGDAAVVRDAGTAAAADLELGPWSPLIVPPLVRSFPLPPTLVRMMPSTVPAVVVSVSKLAPLASCRYSALTAAAGRVSIIHIADVERADAGAADRSCRCCPYRRR